MKATELMIGDFVMVDDNWRRKYLLTAEAYRIETIGEDTSVLSFDSGKVLLPITAIMPMRLTEEILIENGFCKDDWGRFEYKYLKTNGMIVKFGIGGEFNPTQICSETRTCDDVVEHVPIVVVRYVHELQHALRLCGLADKSETINVKGCQK